jgi:sterol desaturase/sphingolipid hydroxylase (fatty acid hydroxylase superfamily)
MKKAYISNSTASERMFKSNLLELFSKVHFTVPLFIYVPLIGYLMYRSFVLQITVAVFLMYIILGFLVWTITEYVLHRFIFHYQPTSSLGLRLHFIFHGVHHDYPKDAKRLVMPPSASIPLAILFYFLFSLFFKNAAYLYTFYAGFIAGYLCYDMVHYAIHHHNFKSSILKKIKQHHMLHHYADATKGYGVSSGLWDVIFRSGFLQKK